jgi:hypothetical protein
MMRWELAVLGLAILGSMTANVAAGEESVPPLAFDRWYALLLQGQPVGFAHVVMREAEGQVVTRTMTQLTIRRGQAQVRLEMENTFTETAGGQPIEAESRQKMGAMSTQMTMRFEAGGVRVFQGEVKAGEAGVLTALTGVDASEPWLTPGAAARLSEAKFAQGVKSFRYRTLDPALGPKVIEVTWEVLEPTVVEVLGKSVPAVACAVGVKVDAQAGPILSRQYVDAKGEMLRQTMALMPGMELDMVMAEEELAKAQVNPPDVLAQMLVKPAGVIAHPRRAMRAEYAVTIAEAEGAAVTLPSLGAQRAQRGAEGWTVTVDLKDRTRRDVRPPTDAERQASATVDSNDPMIRQLAQEAIATLPPEGRDDPVKRAAALRSFVHRHITRKDLSIGFATASEVARTRQGDCTEHAVLLAAMLRAAGMPSRVVTGLIYVDDWGGQRDIFGYHMWTQAWLPPPEVSPEVSPEVAPEVAPETSPQTSAGNGRAENANPQASPAVREGAGTGAGTQARSDARSGWVDVDATLPEGKWFDAAHLALGVSDLQEIGGGNAIMNLLPVLGRLQVRVVAVE